MFNFSEPWRGLKVINVILNTNHHRNLSPPPLSATLVVPDHARPLTLPQILRPATFEELKISTRLWGKSARVPPVRGIEVVTLASSLSEELPESTGEWGSQEPDSNDQNLGEKVEVEILEGKERIRVRGAFRRVRPRTNETYQSNDAHGHTKTLHSKQEKGEEEVDQETALVREDEFSV